jgi:hypothetical protein
MAVGQAMLTGLGYAGEHLRLIEARDARDLAALDARCARRRRRACAARPRFAAQADKRATLELALDHLLAQAPALPADEAIALPAAGAPFGSAAGRHRSAARCA